MNVYINLKDFVNKIEIIQAIKIFNTNNKNISFEINASDEDTIILPKSKNFKIVDESSDEIFKKCNDFSYIVLKDNLSKIKQQIFLDSNENFLNLSFFLKEDNFRSYFFEFDKYLSKDLLFSSISKAILSVKKEKNKDNLSIGVLEGSSFVNDIVNEYKEATIEIVPIEDFLISKHDLIITDSLIGSVMKSSFKALNNFYSKNSEDKKSGFGFRFIKNNSSPQDVMQFLSKYSYIYKDNITFVNVNFEMAINEFLVILTNLSNQ